MENMLREFQAALSTSMQVAIAATVIGTIDRLKAARCTLTEGGAVSGRQFVDAAD